MNSSLAAASPGTVESSPTRTPWEEMPYPVALVLRGRPCLVVGGGRVAGRKASSLLVCGAAVTMVAPEVHEALRLIAEVARTCVSDGGTGRLDVQRRRYRRGEVAEYRLVVTATGDPDVDEAVYEDAESAGVWVNSADDPAHCSMMLPAVWRAGPVTVSVSTGGASPALASWLRTRVAGSTGDHVGRLATLLGEARRRLQEEGRPTGSVDWGAILNGPVTALVAEGRTADAAAMIDDTLGLGRER